MDKFKQLNENVKKYYNEIKKIATIQDIKQRTMLFHNFYSSYWEFMSFINIQISTIIHNPEKVEQVNQFKKFQKFYTGQKIEIDKILSELPDSQRAIIIPYIKQKNENSYSKSKNLANKIQIKIENKNNKYITNLSKEDINKLSKELEDFYNLIINSPTQEYFLIFYEKYTKLMHELNRIQISRSKNNIDKIKKGLIAKKENIDKIFNRLFGNGLNQNILKEKTNANRKTPKNIELNNLNRIVLRNPPQNIEHFEHKVPNLKPNNIIKLRQKSLIGQKPSRKNISRLNELQLKKDLIGLNKTEEVELKKILLQKNKNFQNKLNKFTANLPNLQINPKNTGAGVMHMNPNALQFA